MKPTKALILFLAPLALAACSSDPEWADPEAHEKTMELQERYAPLLVTIDGEERYTDWQDVEGENGTFTGTWQLVWERSIAILQLNERLVR